MGKQDRSLEKYERNRLTWNETRRQKRRELEYKTQENARARERYHLDPAKFIKCTRAAYEKRRRRVAQKEKIEAERDVFGGSAKGETSLKEGEGQAQRANEVGCSVQGKGTSEMSEQVFRACGEEQTNSEGVL